MIVCGNEVRWSLSVVIAVIYVSYETLFQQDGEDAVAAASTGGGGGGGGGGGRRKKGEGRWRYLLAARDDGPAIILIDKGMNDDCYFQGASPAAAAAAAAAADFTQSLAVHLQKEQAREIKIKGRGGGGGPNKDK